MRKRVPALLVFIVINTITIIQPFQERKGDKKYEAAAAAVAVAKSV